MSLKQRIISETTEMFVTYGIKSIRMDDIATNLGISKRTIYEIFGDKENLLLECMRHHSECFGTKKRKITEGADNIIEEMLLMLEDWDNNDANHKMYSNLRKFYPKVHDIIAAEAQEKGYAILREKIAQGVRDGYLLDNINYDLSISIFANSMYGIMGKRQEMLLPKNVSEKDAFKYVITYFFRGIATEKGIKMIDDYIDKEREKRKVNEEDDVQDV